MTKPMSMIERNLRTRGIVRIAGVDEAGCGALAGPVVAAAVILPENHGLPVRDSKMLTPQAREKIYPMIIAKAISWGVGIVEVDEIDRIGIRPATLKAMRLAVSHIVLAEHILVDARTIPGIAIPQTAIIRGDISEAQIAAASIIAKVTRDRIMVEASAKFPKYLFDKHKGYGTLEHRLIITRLGSTSFHRASFSFVV
ncbi:MAG: ribonuclease HII [Patescibacteria group bacterium]